MEYNLPRPYLSFSAYDLWCKNKDAFRRRYYENEKPFETIETIFGKEVHRLKEVDDTVKGSETRIEVELVPGLKLLGYIDSLDEETLMIIDFKTGHRDSKGNPPWNKVKVYKHKQLVFYCLLVLLKYGRYNKRVKLEWIETQFKKASREFDGHTLTATSRELELTGKVEVFVRNVFKYEIDNLKKEILRVAEEISNDYTEYERKR